MTKKDNKVFFSLVQKTVQIFLHALKTTKAVLRLRRQAVVRGICVHALRRKRRTLRFRTAHSVLRRVLTFADVPNVYSKFSPSVKTALLLSCLQNNCVSCFSGKMVFIYRVDDSYQRIKLNNYSCCHIVRIFIFHNDISILA